MSMGFFRWLNDLVAAPVHKEPGKKRRKREDEEEEEIEELVAIDII
ncbi:MAG TPA: hypothetical protein PLV96_12155 [Methanoregulaceae archaeon]|nr:hypothetical protein [Methanoregulaceae archaeon]HQA81539.1 hypothetical protein [Methanoregulaceae archaeon]